jgi:UDP-sulfoquinovose synthase
MDAGLMPNFHYDEVFGTVVNRFVVQAAIGMPLTVYGKGTQIRGYLNLKDTMQCVHLSAREPAGPGELRVFNQITETFSVNELALRVKEVGDRLGYNVRVEHHENPRVESEEHYYNPKYTGLLELGLQPHYLTDEVIEAMFGVVERHRDRINREAIFRGIRWA